MTPDRWQEIKLILVAALDRLPEERISFLNQACGLDKSLLAEVESLLAHQQSGDSVVDSLGLGLQLLELGSVENQEQDDESFLETHQRIGPYEIIRELGQGGVGAVYLAVRADDHYRQSVAIKLIRRGMDTELVLRRFRNERQILAGLDHPNIARLLDGGSTDNHRPYLVMEYIEGIPIDEYCDRHKLNTKERLKIFRQICDAVHNAHQHLVIHRDIKPSNILVTKEGRPKLLDFGIAKLLTPELAAQTLDHTGPFLRLMTPAYASPEQINGQPVTTAADVYSLGVLLFELLTGHKPYRVHSDSTMELMRAVLEIEPLRPSNAILTTQTTQGPDGNTSKTLTPNSVSKTRDGNPDRLRRSLRGDLDNIVLMALRKDPQRRYSSVQQFSEDIRRHLAQLPVIARSDSLTYRASKFIRRNTAGVMAVIMILLTLSVGIIAVNQQRKRAERRFNDVRQLARSVVFDYHDAIADLPGSTPVRERMVKDALKYLDSLAGEASNDQTLQRELATAYRKIGDVQGNSNLANLGDTNGALTSYRKSLTILQMLAAGQQRDGELQMELAESFERIGNVLRTSGDVRQAYQNFEEAIRLLETLPEAMRGEQSQQRKLAGLFYSVGNLKGYPRTANLGDINGALQYHRRALAIREVLSAATGFDINLRLDLQESNRTLANILASQNDLIAAEPHALVAVAIAKDLVSTDHNSARSLRALTEATDSLARLLMRRGKLDQAAMLCDQSIDSAQTALSVDPKNMQARQDLASGHSFAASIYLKKHNAGSALQHLRLSLKLNRAIAADDPNNDAAGRWVAQDLIVMGVALAMKGDLTGAIRSQREGVAIFESWYQNKPSDTMAATFLSAAYDRLAKTLSMRGEPVMALENFRLSLSLADRVLVQHPDNQSLRQQMAHTNFNIGEIYFMLAVREKKEALQVEYRSAARQSYLRSRALLLELQNSSAFTLDDAALLNQLNKKIATSVAVLEQHPK